MAAPNPIASAIAEVPASNLYGRSFVVKPRNCTFAIMSPPPMKGGIASSNLVFPNNIPIPVGPSILCAEKAAKSASRSVRSTGKCGTDWAASTSVTAPAWCAKWMISLAGLIVPSTFDIWVKVTNLGDNSNNFRYSSRFNSPRSVMGMNSNFSFFSSASICQGTRLE